MSGPERDITVGERPEVPWLSVVLGYGPMAPVAAGAVAAWTLTGSWHSEAVRLSLLWAGAILAFLAGVRRGLSFRTAEGPAFAQIATMFCLFVLALASLVACAYGAMIVAVGPLLIGFLAMLVLDPIAARDGQAPLFFARLRPPQLAIAATSLAAILIDLLR